MLLDTNSYRVIKHLLTLMTYCKVDMIAHTLGMSKRSVYYSINSINEILEEEGLEKLKSKRDSGLLLVGDSRRYFEKALSDLSYVSPNFQLTLESRIAIMVVWIFQKHSTIESLARVCNVSVRTAQTDVLEAYEALQGFRIELTYRKNIGYLLQGDESNIRAAIMYYLHFLQDLAEQNLCDFEYDVGELKLAKIIEQVALRAGITTRDALEKKLAFVLMRGDSTKLNYKTFEKEIVESDIFGYIEETLNELPYSEKYYLTLVLYSSRTLFVDAELLKVIESDHELNEWIIDLVNTYENIGQTRFMDKEQLIVALKQHIYYSRRLYKFGLLDINPLKDKILSEYNSEYKLTDLVISRFKPSFGYPVTTDELCYLTLLFGSQIPTLKEQVFKVLIVCASGLSTSLMLKREILILSSKIEVVATVSPNEISQYENLVDAIITSVKVQSKIPTLIVNPVLTNIDRMNILHLVEVSCKSISKDSISKHLYDEISPYIKEEHREKVKEIFNIHRKQVGFNISKEDKSILEIQEEVIVKYERNDLSWDESINAIGNELKEKGFITENYIHACSEAIKKNGPYSMFSDKMYLAHARPEEGALKLSMGVIHFKNPVQFPENTSVKYLILLAVPNYTSHIRILNQIIELYRNNDFIEEIENEDFSKTIYFNAIERYLL